MICIFPFVGFSTNETSKYASQAEALEKNSNYARAALLYERCVYLSELNTEKANFLLKKAECYWAIDELSQAKIALQRINTINLSDSLLFKTQYALAATYYMQGNYQSANSELIQIKAFIQDSSLVQKSTFLLRLTLVNLHEYKAAELQFELWANQLSISKSVKSELFEELKTIFDKKNLPKFKDPEKAKLLSMYLPGTGQFYAGYFWEGAANLSFQLAGLAILGYGICSTYYITGGIVGLGIFQRFYKGGVKRSQFLAEKRNFEDTKEFVSQIQLLQNSLK